MRPRVSNNSHNGKTVWRMYFNVHFLFTDSLSAAIEAISVSTELVEEELKPYLDTVLNVAIERSEYFMFLL